MQRPFAGFVIASFAFASPPAAAQGGGNLLLVCNNARDGPAFAAASYPFGDGWVSEGWFEIADGACTYFEIGGESDVPFEGVAYYFAYTQNYIWDGRYDVCVTPTPDAEFRIFASDWSSCNSGFEHRGFDEVYVRAGYAEVALTPSR